MKRIQIENARNAMKTSVTVNRNANVNATFAIAIVTVIVLMKRLSIAFVAPTMTFPPLQRYLPFHTLPSMP